MKDPLILKRENRSSATATGQGPFSHFRNGIARRCLPYVRNEPRRANETSGNDREALPRIRNRYRGQELDRRLETRCTDHGRRRLQNDFVVLVDVHVDLRNRNRPLQLILQVMDALLCDLEVFVLLLDQLVRALPLVLEVLDLLVEIFQVPRLEGVVPRRQGLQILAACPQSGVILRVPNLNRAGNLEVRGEPRRALHAGLGVVRRGREAREVLLLELERLGLRC